MKYLSGMREEVLGLHAKGYAQWNGSVLWINVIMYLRLTLVYEAAHKHKLAP